MSWLRWQAYLHPNTQNEFFFSEARQRQYLDYVFDQNGIVGGLGGVPGQNLDFYAFEFTDGAGGDYVIVSATRDTPVKRLTILDIRCLDDNGEVMVLPDVEVRQGDTSFFQRNDYCVVKSAAGLRALALDGLKRPPVAFLEWVGEIVPAN